MSEKDPTAAASDAPASDIDLPQAMWREGLHKRPANHIPLSPISFLARTARVHPERIAVAHGGLRRTYAELFARARRLASALRRKGIGPGDVVAILSPNAPAMLEAHFGVPMAGAVLLPLNIRLDPATVAFILGHGEAKLLLVDAEFRETARAALASMEAAPEAIDIEDPEADAPPDGPRLGALEYEALLSLGDPQAAVAPPPDEWRPIALNYTSGTTGDPKGVVYSHRGAYLNAIANAYSFRLTADSVYLWTLPMFHCDGWTFPWAATFAGATHVCLRKVEPARIFDRIAAEGVTHMCAAPVVLTMLIHAPETARQAFPQTVEIATGGAAPPSPVIAAMEGMGFRVTHLYGLTETYGPSAICEWKRAWDGLPLEERARKMARQGVGHGLIEDWTLLRVDGGQAGGQEGAPAGGSGGDGLGELAMRSNTVMMGYLKNPEASDAALGEGWFRTGDLGVAHPDGYVEIKDRAKDIIISGGENISSLEVEEALYAHPKIMEAAVVAAPDPTWGETPCAFIDPVPGARLSVEEVEAWCREKLAGFKIPRRMAFGPLPKTATGKIQKFALRARARSADGATEEEAGERE